MKAWIDLGAANTGLAIGDVTCHARLLNDGTAADFTNATLTEPDSTNLPGLYILSAPNISSFVRGKMWVTATPSKWAVLEPSAVFESAPGAIEGYAGGAYNNAAAALNAFTAWLEVQGIMFGVREWLVDASFSASFTEAVPAGGYIKIMERPTSALSSENELGQITDSGYSQTMADGYTGQMSFLQLQVCAAGGAEMPAGTLTITGTRKYGASPFTFTFSIPRTAAGACQNWWPQRDTELAGAGTLDKVTGGGGVTPEQYAALAKEATLLNGIVTGVVVPRVSTGNRFTLVRGDVTTIDFRLGSDYPLTGKTALLTVRKFSDKSLVLDAVACTTVDADTGHCTYTTGTDDFADAGKCVFDIEVSDTADRANPRTPMIGVIMVLDKVRD